MKRTIAFILALTTCALSYTFAQEVDTLAVVAAPDTLIVAEPLAAPEAVEAEAPEALEAEAVPAEEIELYTEAPKVDKQIFNHLAAGIPITFPLMPQGVGIIEVATTFTPYMQLRLGYTLPIISLLSFTVNDVSRMVPSANIPKTIDYNGKQINIGDSKFNFGTNLGGYNFLLDVFPGKNTSFHFTFGLYFNPSCPNNLLEIKADLSTALKDAGFTPGKYNEVYFGFNEDDPKFRISPDQNGIVKAGIRTNPVHPYVGIGFGRAIKPDSRVRVSFDMGAIYWGSPILVGYDYSLNPAGTAVGFTPERVAKTNDLKSLEEPLQILGAVSWYPMMKLNIFIRIL